MTRAGESDLSDYLVNRTDLARPGSPPSHFEAVLSDSDKAELFWDEPKIPNGPISLYEVSCTDLKGPLFIIASQDAEHNWSEKI